ncbi:MAG: tryptophanase [Cytophagales bacterium]|nr:tryptophanase [Cytophagales bacterium]
MDNPRRAHIKPYLFAMELPYIEPHKIKMVETIHTSTLKERSRWITEAKYNLFKLTSRQVTVDLLTDSGTGAMSDRQWAELIQGDESYAGSASFEKLRETVRELLGYPFFIPTHQGRAAENVLFSALVKEGDVIPGNTHFDTTKGHIEFRKARAEDCTIDEAFNTTTDHPFKGNIDLNKLETVFKSVPREKIPFVLITVTCNSSGGQPVSMANIKAVSALAKQYGIRVLFDAARFAENAYFIKNREKDYENRTIREIVLEMFACGDGATMSAKKDGIANMGGFIALREEDVYQQACTFNIMFEGYLTYGGMSGRDMAALAQGLKEAVTYEYLHGRISQVRYLGNKLLEYGVPVQQPFGGHAIFVDALKFLPYVPRKEFPAQTLAVELYKESGVRGVEIGTLLADRDPVTRRNRYPKLELLRLAIPRRVYTDNHMNYTAAALANIYARRNFIQQGYRIVREAPIMRHFTIELESAEEKTVLC